MHLSISFVTPKSRNRHGLLHEKFYLLKLPTDVTKTKFEDLAAQK